MCRFCSKRLMKAKTFGRFISKSSKKSACLSSESDILLTIEIPAPFKAVRISSMVSSIQIPVDGVQERDDGVVRHRFEHIHRNIQIMDTLQFNQDICNTDVSHVQILGKVLGKQLLVIKLGNNVLVGAAHADISNGTTDVFNCDLFSIHNKKIKNV